MTITRGAKNSASHISDLPVMGSDSSELILFIYKDISKVNNYFAQNKLQQNDDY